jgi:hypothetical protein
MMMALGVTFGVYSFLTRGQRRVTREIRSGALARGWKYRRQWWQGNPMAFRLDGRSNGGLEWILTSGNSSSNESRWSAELSLRFPNLGGETDFVVSPRDLTLPQASPASTGSAFARLSGALAEVSREYPTGLAAFDAEYEVLGKPLDPALAASLLAWPAEVIAPQSWLAWRDPSGLHFHVRLKAPPNWATVTYAAGLGEKLAVW